MSIEPSFNSIHIYEPVETDERIRLIAEMIALFTEIEDG